MLQTIKGNANFSQNTLPVFGMLERHTDYYKLMSSVSLGKFLSFLIPVSPLLSENKKARDQNLDAQQLYDLRKDIQRLFQQSKKKNMRAFADYIHAGVFGNQSYSLPPIALVTTNELGITDAMTGQAIGTAPFGVVGPVWIDIPMGGLLRLAPFDGDTQTAALHELRDRIRLYAEKNAQLLQLPVSIELHFACSLHWARQAFHDRNVYGVRVNTSQAITMDSRDPYVQVMHHLEGKFPWLEKRVSQVKRQLGPDDAELFTASALRQFVATLHEGLGGLQKKGVVLLSGEEIQTLKAQAAQWLQDLYQALGESKFRDRGQFVCSAPALMAALGAFGHCIFYPERADGRALISDRNEAVERLLEIDWTKGTHWAGVAGKWSSNAKGGKLSIGSPKELTSHIFTAIADPSSTSFAQISEGTTRSNRAAGKQAELNWGQPTNP